jgi:uncharacterized protein
MTFTSLVLTLAMLLQSATSAQPITALKSLAESGDVKAQIELGTAYASGDGVTADDSEAVKWFRKAAEKGDAAGEYSLGEMYLTGRGGTGDAREGLKWLMRSAEHGDPRGQANVAVLYAQGQGFPKNESEAAKWMHKAADQGLAAGQFGLGSMYAHGTGVPQNITEAVKWYRKAADQGDSDALNNLSFLLATSNDANLRNPKEAVVLAQKAVDNNTENPSYLDTLATAYYEAGQPNKAADAERRALTLRPDHSSYKEALEKYEAAKRPKQ